MDWVAWHEEYDEPGSSLRRRLMVVQRHIRQALDGRPPGPIRVLSMCAGQGRDLLGVLTDHPRRGDVRARLVELDPRNAALARKAAPAGVEVVTGDAGLTAAYDGVVPVHLALVCGVFGNISDEDIRHTITELPRLCAPGATVIWTRHREPPDLTPAIREWFADNGFEELAFHPDPDSSSTVGANRLTGPALLYRRDTRLFEFIRHPGR
ncbi:MAG TPA: hypothetical protein VGX25_22280 [Actinophytocola sp.]|uniref:hypothetical protein n=1 Tax=Actinophytocola sp. TaxID=1872138 RepID=UPI002DDD9518|nr:hypothetical protein [Actinophytocola sp.]HEV2782129.1 hypothetical protein [Actinophytocola sp.]